MNTNTTVPRGSLVVVGTGLTVGHLTRETVRLIESADIVLFCVADIATQRFIQKLNDRHEDLYFFYAENKPRSQTYAEMTDRILHHVRRGSKVCAVFYGHPGIFVDSSHASIERARSEGFEARMVPGISAIDCLIADLGIDPASYGCQILEATHYLCRDRILDRHSCVILLQIGCVGDWGWSAAGYDGRHLPVLRSKLEAVYGGDYEVVIYQATQLAILPPTICIVKIKDLEAACVTGISTMYIPPVGVPPVNMEVLSRFDKKREPVDAQATVTTGV